MNWYHPEVIISIDDLNRRRIGFFLHGRELILNFDVDEFRETKRHKWKPVCNKQWYRLGYDARATMDRRPVPQTAVDEAVEQVRSSIRYCERKQ